MLKKKLFSGALAAVISFTFALTPVEALTVENGLQGDPQEAWVEGLYGESETPDTAEAPEVPISDEPGIEIPDTPAPEPSEPGTEEPGPENPAEPHPEHEVSLQQSSISMNLARGYKSEWEDLKDFYVCDNNEIYINGLEKDCEVFVRILNSDGNRTKKVVAQLGYDSIVVYPKSTGSYTVEVTVDKKVLTCRLKVFKYYFKRDKKTVADNKSKTWVENESMIALYPKETVTLTTKATGLDGKVKWKSSDKSVATVSSKGKVRAKRAGYTTISATCGGEIITYEVGVASKTAVKALRNCYSWYGKLSYSQPRRMQKKYADCSSFVWRGYKKAGKIIGNRYIAFTAAGESDWCKQQGYRIFEGKADISKLLPGDLIFWCGAKNGRSNGIYHVDIYQGNNRTLTVEREKTLYGTLSKVIIARPCMSTVSGVKAKSTKDHRISLSWTKQYGVSGYTIYRSTKKNGKYTKVENVKGDAATTWTSKKLKKGKTYYYKVRPYWRENKKTFRGNYSGAVHKKVK